MTCAATKEAFTNRTYTQAMQPACAPEDPKQADHHIQKIETSDLRARLHT